MTRPDPHPRRLLCTALLAVACGSGEQPAAAPTPEAPTAPTAPRTPAAAPDAGPDLPRAIVLALAQFAEKDGKPVPGAARLEFLYRKDGRWQVAELEDPESNVFHKAMSYAEGDDPSLLSMGGTAAIVKRWRPGNDGLESEVLWQRDFGGKWSRMRDAEVGDFYGDGGSDIAVATHDQGVVAVLRQGADGSFEVVELDAKPDTFVHEIEVGDLDGDGALEVYATPSEPNRLDGTPQSGEVVRYTPSAGGERTVVAELGERHAKEILVGDVDGDGRDELYVSVEGHMGADKSLEHPVEIRRYEADTPADAGQVIATLSDRLSRFLTAGDVDGDGEQELVAAAFSSGLWLLRPGDDPNAEWAVELIDKDSAGFEHASILTDLDGDGRDELYVASDRHKEVRRYTWDGSRLVREVIYVRREVAARKRPEGARSEPWRAKSAARSGLRPDRVPESYPGGQPSGRPPSTCTCRWKTVWPAPAPSLITSRKSSSSAWAATRRATASRWPSSSDWSSRASDRRGIGSRGITSRCTGAWGLTSRKATARSSS
jgi:hypothetical protein